MNARRVPRFQLAASTLLAALMLAFGPAAGQVTFSDDFERDDGPLTGWTTINGNWQISGGAMTVTSSGAEAWTWAGDPPIVADTGNMEIYSVVWFGDIIPPGDVGRHGGFMFCATQATTRGTPGMCGYTLDWIDRAADHGFRLIRVDSVGGGVPVHTPLVLGTPNVLSLPVEWLIQLEGDIIRLYGDGELIFEVTDATYRGGGVGVWAYGNLTTMFLDDLQITYPPVELKACFTASALAGSSPLVVDFDATCTQSMYGVETYDWDFGDGEFALGQKVTHTFNFGGSYMITLTVTDTKGTSKTATATVEVQESAGSFSDDFERPDNPVDRWIVYQGSWNIETGKLTTITAGAENWVWAGDPVFSFPANFTMTFTLEFRVTPADVVGRHGGVMFCATKPTWRYDPTIAGYTIDWIDRVGDHGIRLIRVDKGVQTVLDIGARDVPDPPVNWEIVVEGEVIRVFGDGNVYLEAKDSTYRKGVFGVWGWSNGQSLAVDDVAVTSPELSPCFTSSPTAAAEVGTDVAFDAGCSSASGTPITTYSWDFGDGATGLGRTATHAYSTEGLKTVKLTIITEGGLSATTERNFDAFIPKDSFEDDFERPDGTVDGWTVVARDWSLLSGTLHVEAPGVDATEAWIYAGDPALRFRGFTAIEFDVFFLNQRPADVNAVGRHGGVFFFAQTTNPRFSGNSGYTIDWIDRAADHGYRLSAYDNGVQRATFVGRGGVDDADPGTRWRVEIDGDTIRLLVDGVLKIETTETADPRYRMGFFGLWAYPGDVNTGFVQMVEFDNLAISVSAIVPPAKPTGLIATAGDAKVSLNWDDNIEADLQGYDVYRDGSKVASLVTQSAYEDSGLTNGQQYCYKVRAVSPGGESPDSDGACATPQPAGVRFRRADTNDDGKVDLTDAVNTLSFLFQGGDASPCQDAADADDSGILDLTDAINTLAWLFQGGAEPPAPGPKECGIDTTPQKPGQKPFPPCLYTKCQ